MTKRKPKHSPGPWRRDVDDEGGPVILDANGEVVVGLHWSNPEDASLVLGDDDTHLIAAAPRLLDVAQKALDALVLINNTARAGLMPHVVDTSNLIAALREAIHEASPTGRAPSPQGGTPTDDGAGPGAPSVEGGSRG